MVCKRFGKSKRLMGLATFFVALILLLTICLPTTQIAYADKLHDADIPEPLGNYDFWQFGNEKDCQIDLEALKTQILGWKLPADTTNIQPILIGIIDTGINAAHPLFSKVLYKQKRIAEVDGTPIPIDEQQEYVIGYNVSGDSSAITDLSSDKHGTHTAGIVATMIVELGLEKFIKIVPIRAVDSSNKFTLPNIVSAIKWACGENNSEVVLGKKMVCDVVNLSLGILSSSIKSSSSWNNRVALEDAIDDHSATTVFVASAGNDSTDTAQSVFYPAAIPGVVSVMSYGKTGKLYYKSNFGGYDLTAPGEDIYSASAGSDYQLKTGTSMASPYVAFGSALLRLRYRFSQTDNAKFAVEPTARQIVKMLRTHPEKTLYVKGTVSEALGYELKVLNLNILATADFSLDKYDIGYADPSRLVLSYAENSVLTQKMDNRKPIKFSVAISPEGEYNTDLNDKVAWWVETTNEDGSTARYQAGEGLNFTFTDEMRGGEYSIYATLEYQNKVLTSNKQIVAIEYQLPDFEKIRIAPLKMLSNYKGNGKDVPSYVGYKTTLSLTNIKYIDQTVEIEWYVNNELKGSGTVFEFAPTQTGVHKIVAKYDGHSVYYNFVLTTKSPRISFWLIALIALVLGSVVFSYILLEAKKRVITSNGEMENGFVKGLNTLLFKLNKKQSEKKLNVDEEESEESGEKEQEEVKPKHEKSAPKADNKEKNKKKVVQCPKCQAYVKFTGEKGQCKYCGTKVSDED